MHRELVVGRIQAGLHIKGARLRLLKRCPQSLLASAVLGQLRLQVGLTGLSQLSVRDLLASKTGNIGLERHCVGSPVFLVLSGHNHQWDEEDGQQGDKYDEDGGENMHVKPL